MADFLGLSIETVSRQLTELRRTEIVICPRTVEVYRASLMGKMHAGSRSELVRMVLSVSWSRDSDHLLKLT